jgi:hypothetical protein
MTNPNDPSLGSNALNRPTQGSTLNVPTHTGHLAGAGQQKQQPVSGGFDNTVNSDLTKPQGGFPTNQPVDGVTSVFEYTTDYRDNYEQVRRPIPAGYQIHHIAPREQKCPSPRVGTTRPYKTGLPREFRSIASDQGCLGQIQHQDSAFWFS